MSENQFFVDSDKLSEKALEKKHRLENDPSVRSNFMEYQDGMEQISSDVMEKYYHRWTLMIIHPILRRM